MKLSNITYPANKDAGDKQLLSLYFAIKCQGISIKAVKPLMQLFKDCFMTNLVMMWVTREQKVDKVFIYIYMS